MTINPSAKITLVLLPGLDGTGLLFADFVAALGPGVEAIVVSYPDRVAALDYAGLESVARSFIPQDRPFFLLAESFSGPIGVSIAASPPPGLQGLILCCSFARNPLPGLAFLGPLVGVWPVSAVPMGWLAFFLLGRFASPGLRGALSNALARVAWPVLRARARAVLAVDASACLPRVRVPLLYLRARHDRVVPRAASQQVVNLAAQTQVLEFDAPHFLLQVLSAPAAAAVLKFMGLRN